MIRVLLAALLLLPDLALAGGGFKAVSVAAPKSGTALSIPNLPQVSIPAINPGVQLPAAASPVLGAAAVPQAPLAAVDAARRIVLDAAQAPAQNAAPEQAAQDLGRRYDASFSAPGQTPSPVDGSAAGNGAAPLSPSAGEGSGGSGGRRAPLPVAPAEKKPFFIRHYKLARAVMWPLLKALYRVDAKGAENLPKGPAIITPNHVTYVDALILSFAANRPMRFMLHRAYYDRMPRFFAALGAIPVASGDQKGRTEEALARARAAVADGQTVVIFPEGALTKNGNMGAFKKGFERIAEGLNVPVVPAHLDNLWGSFFSNKRVSLRQALSEAPRRVGVRFGAPQAEANSQAAREAVQELSVPALEERVRRSQTTLPRAFLRAAKRAWNKRAAADSTGMDLTYGKALTGAVLMSRALEKRLGQAKNVAVLLPPTAGGVLANVALSIGGRVPINLNYSSSVESVEHALRVSGAAYVVTSRAAVERLKAKGATVPDRPMIFLEDLKPEIPEWKKALTYVFLRLLPRSWAEGLFLRKAARSLDETATVVFTSGSTSLPKGAELSHLNLQADMQMVEDAFAFTPDETILGTLPFFHSFGFTMTLWFTLTRGLAGAYHTHPLDFKPIQKLADKFQPTLVLGTPTFLQKYADALKPSAFAKLKWAIGGAEKLQVGTAAAFEKAFGVRPLEGYGSTELSPVAAISVPDVKGQKGWKEGSVGAPLPGSAAKVVDPATGKTVPYGSEGMLMIKGAHVMKGYLGQPEKTAEVVKDGWYLTGDLVVQDRDGFIFFKGRAGIKISGEYIPGEAVAERLQQAAGLEGAPAFVVTSVPDEKKGERLVVIHTPAWKGDPAALIAKLRERPIPNLWVPSASSFYEVPEFPMLGGGLKVDLKAVRRLALKFEDAKSAGK